MGLKIKTRPFTFEIEVKELKGEIPEEEYPNFIKWLEHQPLELDVSRNYEYYTLDNGDDIAVSFYIKTIPPEVD